MDVAFPNRPEDTILHSFDHCLPIINSVFLVPEKTVGGGKEVLSGESARVQFLAVPRLEVIQEDVSCAPEA
jgi:hypothetical protein